MDAFVVILPGVLFCAATVGLVRSRSASAVRSALTLAITSVLWLLAARGDLPWACVGLGFAVLVPFVALDPTRARPVVRFLTNAAPIAAAVVLVALGTLGGASIHGSADYDGSYESYPLWLAALWVFPALYVPLRIAASALTRSPIAPGEDGSDAEVASRIG